MAVAKGDKIRASVLDGIRSDAVSMNSNYCVNKLNRSHNGSNNTHNSGKRSHDGAYKSSQLGYTNEA